MKRLLALLTLVSLSSQAAFAQVAERSLDQKIDDFLAPISKLIENAVFFQLDQIASWLPPVPFIVLWLLGGGIFFTIYMGFPNIRGFRQSLKIVTGTYDDPNDPGEVTHFQALTAAVSGTVGLGNIAGVAIAISVGGAGATFWMILAGLFGMTSKFVECTLGLKYREIDEHGVVSGGPMYYMTKGLAAMGMPSFGKILAVIFAVLCIGGAFGAGAMFQINQSTAQFASEFANITGSSFFADEKWVFGIIFAGFVGLVIIGGIKKITHVTEFLVPIMALLYVSASLVIIFGNIGELPSAIGQIFSGAFTADGVAGGIVGVLIQGLRRATFSNEAGLGSASIAHSAAKTTEPVAEGLVALLEPFIDTVVICTITALVIIMTGSIDPNASGTAAGIALTSKAFATVTYWFPYLLTVAVIMFAFSTSITWFYYGQRSFLWLIGLWSEGDKPKADLLFKLSYLATLVAGSAMQLTSVMGMADSFLLAMGFPNIVALFLFRKEVKGMLTSYFARIKSGEIKPYIAPKAQSAAAE